VIDSSYGNDPSRRCNDTDNGYLLVTNTFSQFDCTPPLKNALVTRGQGSGYMAYSGASNILTTGWCFLRNI
jgi:hypothetical protein